MEKVETVETVQRGKSFGDGASREGSGKCVERGKCGESGGVEFGVDTV